jgi:hypothetical protein
VYHQDIRLLFLKFSIWKIFNLNMTEHIGITGGGGGGQGGQMHCQYFSNQGIVYLVTQFSSGRYKVNRKKTMKNLHFMGPIFPSLKFDSLLK